MWHDSCYFLQVQTTLELFGGLLFLSNEPMEEVFFLGFFLIQSHWWCSHIHEHMNQNKKTTPDLFTFLFLNALPLSVPYRFPLRIIGPEKRIDSETRNHWRWHTTWANKPTAWLEEAVSPLWGALQLFLKIMLDPCVPTPPPSLKSSPALMPSL